MRTNMADLNNVNEHQMLRNNICLYIIKKTKTKNQQKTHFLSVEISILNA